MNSITIIGFVLVAIFGVVFLMYTSKNKGTPSKKDAKVTVTKEEAERERIKNSKKVVEKDKNGIPEKDIADFMEFDKIADDMIIQDGGKRFTMVVQCKGINYDLMSDVEQMAVEEGFITFLNTLKFPIQLYVQARAVDLKENLNIYKKSVGGLEAKYNEISDKYRNMSNDIDADYDELNKLKFEVEKQANILGYAQDITRYVEKISLNKSILQRKFYIALSYRKEEIATTSDFNEQELYNICERELYTRAQTLISALIGCSVVGKTLTSNELAELLYISYNRDDEKLLDIKTALDSGFYRLYSTSKDVFEKREEAMQKEVEEEAKRRVQDAIQELLKNQQKKTPDELVEEYEQRVDKEALNIIDESQTPREAKKELKSKIIESHVMGVEARKIDRKIRDGKLPVENNVLKNGEKNSIIVDAKSEQSKLEKDDESIVENNFDLVESPNKDIKENINNNVSLNNDIKLKQQNKLNDSTENENITSNSDDINLFVDDDSNDLSSSTLDTSESKIDTSLNNESEKEVSQDKVNNTIPRNDFDDRLGASESDDKLN